jgi:hypothetical protein
VSLWLNSGVPATEVDATALVHYSQLAAELPFRARSPAGGTTPDEMARQRRMSPGVRSVGRTLLQIRERDREGGSAADGLAISKTPPTALTRSWRPTSPEPRLESTPPMPSSVTLSQVRMPSVARSMCTVSARACLSTLVNASETTGAMGRRAVQPPSQHPIIEPGQCPEDVTYVGHAPPPTSDREGLATGASQPTSSQPSKLANTPRALNYRARPKLAEQFQASRNTIRSALGELDGRGLIDVVHGKGRIVLPRTPGA